MERSLLDHSRPLFMEGLALAGSDPRDPDALRTALLASLQRFDENARRDGHSARAVEEACFALAAWLDEIAFSCPSISLEWLGHSIAVHKFQDPAAGSSFFAHMSSLHQKADMAGALDVFAQAIVLGFQGRYRLESPEALPNIVQEVHDKRSDAPPFASPWMPSLDHDPGKRGRERTGKSLWWVGSGLLALGILLYILLAFLSAT